MDSMATSSIVESGGSIIGTYAAQVYNIVNSVSQIRTRDLSHTQFVRLYQQLLKQVKNNNVDCSNVECAVDTKTLMAYLQSVFQISNRVHEDLLQKSNIRLHDDITKRLNVEIVEAKDLAFKSGNVNTFNYVRLILCSNKSNAVHFVRKTSLIKTSANPVWKELFSVPLDGEMDENDANLKIQVMKLKMNDTKGKRNPTLDELPTTVGKLIGEFIIPLSTITPAESVMWCNLMRCNRDTCQGILKIHLDCRAVEFNKQTFQEFRYLLKSILFYELQNSKVVPYWWSGTLSPAGETILKRYVSLSGLGSNDIYLGKYAVYCEVHEHHPVSVAMLDTTIGRLMSPIQNSCIVDQQLALFWKSTSKLLSPCMVIIQEILLQNQINFKSLIEVLNLIYKVFTLEARQVHNSTFISSLLDALNETVQLKVSDVLDALGQCIDVDYIECNERKLLLLVKITQYCITDLQEAMEIYDKLFLGRIGFPYAKKLFILYEKKLSTLIQPIVGNICISLRYVVIPYESSFEFIEVNVDVDGQERLTELLFDLLHELREMIQIGKSLKVIEDDSDNYKILTCHTWFSFGVIQKLDILMYRIVKNVKSAIKLDQLTPICDTIKCTTSAVDTLAIFTKIKLFWTQLQWPLDVNTDIFITKIINHVCNCSLYYVEEIINHLEELNRNSDNSLVRICYVINSINHLTINLNRFVGELYVGDYAGLEPSLQYVQNVRNDMTDRTTDLLKSISVKICSPIYRLLAIEQENYSKENIDNIMAYLEKCHQGIHNVLNENNFQRVFNLIWSDVVYFINDIIDKSALKPLSTEYYAKVRHVLHLMLENFIRVQHQNEDGLCCKDVLHKVKSKLELYASKTSVLIHQYYMDRLREQLSMTTATFGVLSIECYFQENNLRIEVLNARDLVPPFNCNSSCNPYVRIEFVSMVEELFDRIKPMQTIVCANTLYPLFDSKHVISLSTEQKELNDTLIMFRVIHSGGLFKTIHQNISEGFLRLSDVKHVDIESSGKRWQQRIEITLTRTSDSITDNKYLRALHMRRDDKMAIEFLKKIPQNLV